MSSIYKKGRDGYYYYQTYVYNPESKKKDKRIFHALRTKDLDEARSKQYEFDIKYEKQRQDYSDSKNPSIKFSPRSAMVVCFGAITLTILIFDFFKTNTVEQNRSVSITPKKLSEIENNIDVVPEKQVIDNQIDSIIEKKPERKKTNRKQKSIEPKVIIPNYTIERMDKLSGPFNQGKVYVTIDEKTSNESQRLLCKELVKRYSEFSNIVICLYANNSYGKELAKGNDKTVSIQKQKKFWLAMYTYNTVEGEYFDNNPSGYLGNY